jgi:succinate-acetate transporter protein
VRDNGRPLVVLAIVGFAASATAILAAPLLLGDDYDWITRSVSESAAQQTPGAWLGRLALVLSGLATILVSIVRAREWGALATTAFTLFGLFWTLTAVYSTESWVESTPRDDVESALHSVFATAMAVICLGALVLAVRGRYASGHPLSGRWRMATVGLIVAASGLPLGAMLVPTLGGLFQRAMFFVAYAWFTREALFAVSARGQAYSAGPTA